MSTYLVAVVIGLFDYVKIIHLVGSKFVSIVKLVRQIKGNLL